jgi:anti-anti-sigma factor
MTEHTESGGPVQAAPPSSPPLRLSFNPSTRRISLDGELDFANGAVLGSAIAAIHGRDPGPVTVDIHDLQFTDAASVTLFLASCKALSGENVPILIDGASPSVRRACHAAGLDALLV